MNKSQKVYLNTGDTRTSNLDKYIKVKLEQDTETIEFMTLKIGTTEAYQNFNADYGVLVGRVIANDGIGIPNAKISIFIPLDDADENDRDIYSIYPYKTPRDKNNEGKRYNLLPRVSKPNPQTGIISPKQPFGSFPTREEVLTNESILKVYKKYYKYSTITNDSGDYMIFGVPTGTQTVHMSVDITDIGKYSMTPASMVTNLGYSENLFTDGGSKIKVSKDLDDLPNIETQEISVDVIPFWGDVDNFEIGITRQDFRIRSVLKNTFTIFGSVFSDDEGKGWGYSCSDDKNKIGTLYRMKNDYGDLSMSTKRTGSVTEKIYYYPPNISDAQINTGNYVDQMLLLDPSEYSIYKQNGDFILIISCNRDKIIINDDGTETPVDNDYSGGLYTSFRGFMTIEISRDDLSLNWQHQGNNATWTPRRERLKIPQMATAMNTFREEVNSDAYIDSEAWRRLHYRFCGGCIYSISRFAGLTFNSADDKKIKCNGCIDGDAINCGQLDPIFNTGVIQTNDTSDVTDNAIYEYPSNTCYGSRKLFGANWMNISIYLNQFHHIRSGYSCLDGIRQHAGFAYYYTSAYPVNDNSQLVAGVYTNTGQMARSDYHWTDFIEVPKEDIQALNNSCCKGITANSSKVFATCNNTTAKLTGKYRNGCYLPTGQVISWSAVAPTGGGRCCGDFNCTTSDKNTYIYKGYNESDVIKYMVDLGLA